MIAHHLELLAAAIEQDSILVAGGKEEVECTVAVDVGSSDAGVVLPRKSAGILYRQKHWIAERPPGRWPYRIYERSRSRNRRLGLRPHARVLELHEAGLEVILELLKLRELLLRLLDALQALERLERAVVRAAQVRVDARRLPVPRQRFLVLPCAGEALGDVVGGVRIARVLLRDEAEMLERFGRLGGVQL